MSGKFAPLTRCPGTNGEHCDSLIDRTRNHCSHCRAEITQHHKIRQSAKAGQKS
jgi:hypothetical protein